MSELTIDLVAPESAGVAEDAVIARPEEVLLISTSKTIAIRRTETGADILVNGKLENFPPKEDQTPYTSVEKEVKAQELKRRHYVEYLKNHFENLVILTGAGSSFGFGGKLMFELWDCVQEKLGMEAFKEFCIKVGYIKTDSEFADCPKDLEKLLSRASIAKEFLEHTPSIEDIIKTCEKVIFKNCKFELTDDAPHEEFLNKVTNRKPKDPRVKIFTLNYDTSFEKAAINGNFTIIDGFSFSFPRTLSGRNFDYDIIYREKSRIKEEESFVNKVFHLYKPHGSVNWEYSPDGQSVVINQNTKKPLMIYPKDNKYENSYDQPFFEMMSRFQQNLRKDNVLLITIGFSFNDKHFVTAIKEAVSQNPSFRLIIINKKISKSEVMNWFIDKAKKLSNIMIIDEEFKDFVTHYPSSSLYSDRTL